MSPILWDTHPLYNQRDKLSSQRAFLLYQMHPGQTVHKFTTCKSHWFNKIYILLIQEKTDTDQTSNLWDSLLDLRSSNCIGRLCPTDRTDMKKNQYL